jgi:hypothetical protein
VVTPKPRAWFCVLLAAQACGLFGQYEAARDHDTGTAPPSCEHCIEQSNARCVTERTECVRNAACASILECATNGSGNVGPCSWSAACVTECANLHPSGKSTFLAYVGCAQCASCRNACLAGEYCDSLGIPATGGSSFGGSSGSAGGGGDSGGGGGCPAGWMVCAPGGPCRECCSNGECGAQGLCCSGTCYTGVCP